MSKLVKSETSVKPVSSYQAKQGKVSISKAVAEVMGRSTEEQHQAELPSAKDVSDAIDVKTTVKISLTSTEVEKDMVNEADRVLALAGVANEDQAAAYIEGYKKPEPPVAPVVAPVVMVKCPTCPKEFTPEKFKAHVTNCARKAAKRIADQEKKAAEVVKTTEVAPIPETPAVVEVIQPAVVTPVEIDPLAQLENVLGLLKSSKILAAHEIETLGNQAVAWFKAEYLPAERKAKQAKSSMKDLEELLQVRKEQAAMVQMIPINPEMVKTALAGIKGLLEDFEAMQADPRLERIQNWPGLKEKVSRLESALPKVSESDMLKKFLNNDLSSTFKVGAETRTQPVLSRVRSYAKGGPAKGKNRQQIIEGVANMLDGMLKDFGLHMEDAEISKLAEEQVQIAEGMAKKETANQKTK